MPTRPGKLNAELAEATLGMLVALAPPGLSADEATARARVIMHVAQFRASGVTLRELERALRSVPSSIVRRVVAGACASRVIAAVQVSSGPRGGRPTVRYCLALGDTTAHGATVSPETTEQAITLSSRR